MMAIVPSPFEIWATRQGYDVAPAVSPSAIRTYADPDTQKLFEAWSGGAADTARLVTEDAVETEALRDKIFALAVSA